MDPRAGGESVNLSRALFEYLQTSQALTGHAAIPFVAPQKVGDHVCSDRNEAREALRSVVGSQIYLQRTPQNAKHTSITISTTDAEPQYGLAGEQQERRDYLTLRIKSKGENYGDRVSIISDLLNLCVSGFHADFWSELYISECLVESVSDRTTPVGDGSDNHVSERLVDLSIVYSRAAPVYDSCPFSAGVTFTTAAGVGPSIGLESTTYTPRGRELTDLSWSIRERAEDAELFGFSGAPDAAISGTSGVSGTYAAPQIDRATHGLYGNVHVTLTASLGTGETDAAIAEQVLTEPEGPDPSGYRIGMNMSRQVYSGTASGLIDKATFASPYTANVGGGVVDEMTGDHVSGEVKYQFFAREGRTLPEGTYDVTWTGPATGPASFVVGPATDEIDLTYEGAGTDFSIVRQGSSGTYEAPWDTRYEVDVGECVRFMEALRINEAEWQDNHPSVKVIVGASNTFHHKLPSWSWIRTFCDNYGKDPWISIHHLASDATVQAMAQAFATFTGTVYFEHSNELWNSAFPQHGYAYTQALADGGYKDAQGNQLGEAASVACWHADRTDYLGGLIKGILPSAVIVLGAWSDVPNQYNQTRTYSQSSLSNIDAVAIAPYIGRVPLLSIDDSVINAASDAAIIQYARDDLNDRVKDTTATWKANVVDDWGKRLLAYEAGFHLTKNATVEDRLITASQSSEAGDLMDEYLEWWRDTVGDLMCVFQDVSNDAWGHWQYEHDPVSPRAQSYLDNG